MLSAIAATVLVGVLHVHHEPSHDSSAGFMQLLAGARIAELDFLILTEHVPDGASGALPAGERAGFYFGAAGDPLLIMVGAEFGTRSGHVLGYQIPRLVAAGDDAPPHRVIDDIHALGGFAVVPHPLSYGGWHAWNAPFDGLEVHNGAAELRAELRPWLPFRLLQLAFSRDAAMRGILERPKDALDLWETLLRDGRQVLAFSGADAHRNTNLLGWQLDPYEQAFSSVQTICAGDDLRLEPGSVWSALRSGRCRVRYPVFEDQAQEAEEVVFPSGRTELQLNGGRRVLEIRQPPGLTR